MWIGSIETFDLKKCTGMKEKRRRVWSKEELGGGTSRLHEASLPVLRGSPDSFLVTYIWSCTSTPPSPTPTPFRRVHQHSATGETCQLEIHKIS
jgi:hypothetical protein